MFHKKVSIKKSSLDGIGLFADEEIIEGQKIYTENLKLDLVISDKELSLLSSDEKMTIKHYGYFDKRINKWHLSFDDIRFCNHSLSSNITLSGNDLIASRDIRKGEELTQNYEEFEDLRDKLK